MQIIQCFRLRHYVYSRIYASIFATFSVFLVQKTRILHDGRWHHCRSENPYAQMGIAVGMGHWHGLGHPWWGIIRSVVKQ